MKTARPSDAVTSARPLTTPMLGASPWLTASYHIAPSAMRSSFGETHNTDIAQAAGDRRHARAENIADWRRHVSCAASHVVGQNAEHVLRNAQMNIVTESKESARRQIAERLQPQRGSLVQSVGTNSKGMSRQEHKNTAREDVGGACSIDCMGLRQTAEGQKSMVRFGNALIVSRFSSATAGDARFAGARRREAGEVQNTRERQSWITESRSRLAAHIPTTTCNVRAGYAIGRKQGTKYSASNRSFLCRSLGGFETVAQSER